MPHRLPPKYITQGFVPATLIQNFGLLYLDMATVAIDKGDAIFDNGAGFATNVGTAFAATFRGIAHATQDNSVAGAVAGDRQVAIIPAGADVQYWVKAGTTTLAQTDVGEIVDLVTNDSIDPADVTLIEWGFLIDEIDISTLAVAANTQGFALGRFQKTPQ